MQSHATRRVDLSPLTFSYDKDWFEVCIDNLRRKLPSCGRNARPVVRLLRRSAAVGTWTGQLSGKKSEEADWGPIERVRVDRIAAVGDGRASEKGDSAGVHRCDSGRVSARLSKRAGSVRDSAGVLRLTERECD